MHQYLICIFRIYMQKKSCPPSRKNASDIVLSLVTSVIADHDMIMSHALTLSFHEFSLVEKWLLEQSVEKIDSATLKRISSAANVGWKVTVTAQDYANKFGVDTHTASEQLQLAVDSLFGRSVRYQTKDRSGKHIDRKVHWITGITGTQEGDRRKRNDTYRINFSPEVVSFLVNPGCHASINEPDPAKGISAENSPTALPARLRLPRS